VLRRKPTIEKLCSTCLKSLEFERSTELEFASFELILRYRAEMRER
jgi:hypothetical protein